MRTRGWRRFQKERIRNKARKVGGLHWSDHFNYSISKKERERHKEEFVKYYIYRANDLKSCSCYMCGNPRRYWKDMTLQEKRQNERDSRWRLR
jgi:hypothetical protein